MQASLLELLPKRRTRRFRIFYRNNKNWWETVLQRYSKKRFKYTFKVSRTTLNFILSKIQHRIPKEYVTKDSIPPKQTLPICLYRLGHGDYLYTIAEMVGLAESTVCQIAVEVSKTIVDRHFLKSDEDFKEKLLEMDAEGQLPDGVSGIGCNHLPIKCPNSGQEVMKQYYNFKNFYSVVLLALVDAKYNLLGQV